MKKLYFVLIFLISFWHTNYAQTGTKEELDAKKKAIDQYHKQDTVLAGMIVNYGAMLIRVNLEEALKYTNKGEQLSIKLNWQRGIISCLRQKGVIYQEQSKFSEAIAYQFKALKAFEDMRGISTSTQLSFKAGTYINIAQSYTSLKQFKQAISYAKKAIVLAKKAEEPYFVAIGYLAAGVGYLDKNEHDKSDPSPSEAYLDSTYILAKQHNFSILFPLYYLNKGLVKTQQGQYKAAINFFEQGEKITGTDSITFNQIIQGKAEALYYMKDYKKALPLFKKTNQIAKQLGVASRQAENELLISDIYEKLRDNKLALTHYKRHIILRDSAIGAEKRVEAVKTEMQFEAEKKQALANEEIKYQKNFRNYSIAGIGVLLVAGIAIFYFYKKHRDSVQKQKELLYKAQTTETEMRILRLQMNPHFIFNSLNSISDYIHKNDIEKADYYLAKFAKLMRGILENAEEKEITLAEEIKMMETYMQLEASRLKHKFTYQINIADDIEMENTYVLPLILQPFIENSIWHGLANKDNVANTGKISIDISKHDDILKFVIEDNGIGRKNSASNKKSYGIKITNDRLALLKTPKANIKITDLTQGTRVEINLPFETEV